MVSSRQPSLGSLGNVCGVQTDDIFHQPGYRGDKGNGKIGPSVYQVAHTLWLLGAYSVAVDFNCP